MKAKETLDAHLKARIGELRREQASGRKIVGYYPAEYMPEELVLASGAIPLGLARGGDSSSVAYSGSYIHRWMDSFCRGQIGARMMKEDPYYQIVDLYVAPVVDMNVHAVADCWTFFSDANVFKMAVPHEKTDRALDFFHQRLFWLRQKLEELTGNKITDEKLKESIVLCNKERKALRDISLLRKAERLPISGFDFIQLNHFSYIADKKTMVDVLEAYYEELKNKDAPVFTGPRILFTGSTLAMGDYKVHELVAEAGGDIVIEQFSEALKDYWDDVQVEGDLMENLAYRYFMKKVCHGVFVPGKERLEFIVKLAKDFKVNGVIWYQPMYRDSFDMEAYYFPRMLKEGANLPSLQLETDYDTLEKRSFETRIETFLEAVC